MTETAIQERLLAFIKAELLFDPESGITADTPLITGGYMDSFALAQIAVFVEGAFDVYIPDTDLTVENMDTVSAMARRVVQGLG